MVMKVIKEIGIVVKLVVKIIKVQIHVSVNVKIENCLTNFVNIQQQVKDLDVNFIEAVLIVKTNQNRIENDTYKRLREEVYLNLVGEHFDTVLVDC